MTLLETTSNIISYGTVNTNNSMRDREEDRLLYPHSVYEPDTDIGTEDEGSIGSSVQDGVRKIEAINLTWTQRSLMIAYLGWASFVYTSVGNILTGLFAGYFSWRFVLPSKAKLWPRLRRMLPVRLRSIL
jgi:hypothetical protein